MITLDMIARSDADGLRRAIESARPHVDFVQVGVDGRSDQETVQAARELADLVFTFGPSDIGLSRRDWDADNIHFANARNLGRQRVRTPWTLVIDTDEFIESPIDLREIVREDVSAFSVGVFLENGVRQDDPQRLARSHFRWSSGTHNQLSIEGSIKAASDVRIHHDPSKRSEKERTRRDQQRASAMRNLEALAEQGDMAALYHVSKQAAYDDLESGARWVSKFRNLTEVHGPASFDRSHLASVVSARYFDTDNVAESEKWAVRALLDGPRIEAFCLLGEASAQRRDLAGALIWYELACETPVPSRGIHASEVEKRLRFYRREELRRCLNR